MKLFNDQTQIATKGESLKSHQRVNLYEREEQVKANELSLSQRYEGDKRIKQYGTPSFNQAKIRQRLEHKKAQELAEKVADEQQKAAKLEGQRLKMIQEGKSKEEIDAATNKALNRAENLAQTGEQLKAALSVGSFKFSAKERAVLNKILK